MNVPKRCDERMNDQAFKYEHFFELSPDLLCIAGYDGYFKKINPAVATVLGYSMEELYARPINDFVYHDDKDITAQVRSELTRSKPLFNFENRYLTKDGNIVWLSWTSLPVDSERLIFAIAKDITHRKRLEAERNTMLANLTKINNELKHVAYTTSHDLRSPVNNLLSVFQLIDTSTINDQETLQFMEMLQLAGQNIRETLNNYLDLLKDKQGLHATVEEVDLRECLDNVLRSIGFLIQRSGAAIRADFSIVPKILFNKASLESVFMNLLTNSIKYARHDCNPEVTVFTENVNGITRMIFSDNGRGFDMEQVKDDIFGLHQKFHDHADSKGIGLYLVHSHITNSGGRISVESKINEGTKFTISFKRGSS